MEEEREIPTEAIRLEKLLNMEGGDDVIKLICRLIEEKEDSFDSAETELEAARLRGASGFGRELIGRVYGTIQIASKVREHNEQIKQRLREKMRESGDSKPAKPQRLPHYELDVPI